MAGSINRVIAGDYAGATVLWDGVSLVVSGFMTAKCKLDKTTVTSYNIVNTQNGLFSVRGYTVSIDFVDGKKSLLSLSPGFYDALVRILF